MPAHPAAAAGRTVLDPHDISRALTRIAHEILERNKGAADLVLLGHPVPRCPAGPSDRRQDGRGRDPATCPSARST